MVQPSLTLHGQELLLCGPTRVHLRGRLGGGGVKRVKIQHESKEQIRTNLSPLRSEILYKGSQGKMVTRKGGGQGGKEHNYLSRSEMIDPFIQAVFQTTVVLFNRLDLRQRQGTVWFVNGHKDNLSSHIPVHIIMHHDPPALLTTRDLYLPH